MSKLSISGGLQGGAERGRLGYMHGVEAPALNVKSDADAGSGSKDSSWMGKID